MKSVLKVSVNSKHKFNKIKQKILDLDVEKTDFIETKDNLGECEPVEKFDMKHNLWRIIKLTFFFLLFSFTLIHINNLMFLSWLENDALITLLVVAYASIIIAYALEQKISYRLVVFKNKLIHKKNRFLISAKLNERQLRKIKIDLARLDVSNYSVATSAED